MKLDPHGRLWLVRVLLDLGDIEQLSDQAIQTIDIIHHRTIELASLRFVNITLVESLKKQLERSNRTLQFMSDSIKKVTLTAIQVDLLNAPNKV